MQDLSLQIRDRIRRLIQTRALQPGDKLPSIRSLAENIQVNTLDNPTGITTSQSHRHQLLRLAERYHCLILKDNAYEGLNFESAPALIKALDRQDIVTYVGTFSKTLMPGIRVGYLVVAGEYYQPLVERKLLNDYHVSTVSQAIISKYLAEAQQFCLCPSSTFNLSYGGRQGAV